MGNLEDRLHREIRKFIGDYDYLIIDCPLSADSPISQSALLVADLALVPVVPSPPDLWAGIAIRQVLQTVEAVNEGLQACLLINQRKPGTRLASKTLELLPKYGIPILKTQIGDREAFRHAAAAGLTAADIEALTALYRLKPKLSISASEMPTASPSPAGASPNPTEPAAPLPSAIPFPSPSRTTTFCPNYKADASPTALSLRRASSSARAFTPWPE